MPGFLYRHHHRHTLSPFTPWENYQKKAGKISCRHIATLIKSESDQPRSTLFLIAKSQWQAQHRLSFPFTTGWLNGWCNVELSPHPLYFLHRTHWTIKYTAMMKGCLYTAPVKEKAERYSVPHPRSLKRDMPSSLQPHCSPLMSAGSFTGYQKFVDINSHQ